MDNEWLANDPVDDWFLGPGSPDAGQPTKSTICATEDDQPSKSDGSQAYGPVMNNIGSEMEDEFAELDAWFASGAVEIL